MKKVILLSLLLLSNCATLKYIFGSASFEHCGKVDTLEVYVKEGAWLTCKEAMDTTEAAYEILWTKGPGVLNESWRVEYRYGALDASDPWARTEYDKHLIQVQEQAPRSILHELGHAYMSETHSGGRSQHRKMCADANWQKLEREFEVKPYCHLVRNGQHSE